ncbi:MAG TPA: TolC family protein [Spirosoma sp.]|nr:TolC family protein [Spirosoma sp.]
MFKYGQRPVAAEHCPAKRRHPQHQARLSNLDTKVLQARKALQIANTRLRLRNGVITNVEFQSAETGVEKAELGWLNYQYQLSLNQVELKRLLGEGS